MERFMTKLRKLKPKISIKYLIFIFLISTGCLYQVIQVSLVFFEFETKIDVSIDKNELGIPKVSFCKSSSTVFRNGEQATYGLTPAQVYKKTFGFGEIFMYVDYCLMDKEDIYYGKNYRRIRNLANYEEDVQSQKFNSTVDIQIEKTISHHLVCYNFNHPQDKIKWPKNANIIYRFILYYQKRGDIYIALSPQNQSPNNENDNVFEALAGNVYFLEYSRTVTYLMPSPYKTNCFDYNQIGCKSRQDCIDKCHCDYILNYCNSSLPLYTIVDNHNDKDKFTNDTKCYKKPFCEKKYKLPECIIEYYTTKPISVKKYKNFMSKKQIDDLIKRYTNGTNFNLSTNDINSISTIIIMTHSPNTIYRHSAQQPPVEFICFIGGIISLWTGFSVYSIYNYGKQVFSKKQSKIEPMKPANNKVNKKIVQLINNKTLSLESKLNKVMKIVKISKKKNHVFHDHIA